MRAANDAQPGLLSMNFGAINAILQTLHQKVGWDFKNLHTNWSAMDNLPIFLNYSISSNSRSPVGLQL